LIDNDNSPQAASTRLKRISRPRNGPSGWPTKRGSIPARWPTRRPLAKLPLDELPVRRPYFAFEEQAGEQHPGHKPEEIRARHCLTDTLWNEFHTFEAAVLVGGGACESNLVIALETHQSQRQRSTGCRHRREMDERCKERGVETGRGGMGAVPGRIWGQRMNAPVCGHSSRQGARVPGRPVIVSAIFDVSPVLTSSTDANTLNVYERFRPSVCEMFL